MKIEKISDTKIRCTLVDSDLTSRDLQFSDLIFKREKARSLFEDIMEKALAEFGFTPGDGPLMIEALPNDDNTMSLIFTKLEDDHLLNSSTSKGSSNGSTSSKKKNAQSEAPLNFTYELIGSKNYKEQLKENRAAKKRPKAKGSFQLKAEDSYTFCFNFLDEVITTAKMLAPSFTGESSLHFDYDSKFYILNLSQRQMDGPTFTRICNSVPEFAFPETCTQINLAYLEEHCRCIATTDAVELLSSI